MRRLLLFSVLLGLLVVPAASQAATPGVNVAGIPGAAELDQAQATGARYVRVFALGSQLGSWASFQNVVTDARARGMASSS